MTAGRAYRSERCMGGQLVYTPDGDVLDKHLHVLRRASGGFDWVPETDAARIDQLVIALLADSATKNIALDHYKEIARYLHEEVKGDEWRLPTSDISTDIGRKVSASLMRRRHWRTLTSRRSISTGLLLQPEVNRYLVARWRNVYDSYQ